MRKDKEFKDSFKIKDAKKVNNDIMSGFEYYNPDLVLEEDDEIIILEHSSTGDRKVHIGELSQFIDFSINHKSDKMFDMILLLDGEGDNKAISKYEAERLRYYIENVFRDKLDKVNFIGVIKYDCELIGLSLGEIKSRCECVFQKEVECESICYKKCIEIVCSNIKKEIRDDENFIKDVTELIETELDEDISFEINPSEELDECIEYPVFAVGDIEIDHKEKGSNLYSLVIERQTIDETLILSVEIDVRDDYIYSGINDDVYKLKTEIKDVLNKGFKNIYWQFDEHNNSICKELYSRIHVLENEFRQLIIEFMVKSYGYQWEDRLVNKVLKKKITEFSSWYKTNFEEFRDVYIDLFNLQVNDLIDFLKSAYETDKVQKETEDYFKNNTIYNKLSQKGSDKIAETIKMNLDNILNNNSVWHLYMIDILGEDFIDEWKKFEKIRNMVAHNKPICNKLYQLFEECEGLLSDRFKNFRVYIKNNFDSINKETIDIITGKREIELQNYEDMYREEAGLHRMPNDEEEVFEEINEDSDVIEFNNLIEEYVGSFKSLAEELIGYLQDIDYENIDFRLRQNIIEQILVKDSAEISEEEFVEYIEEFIDSIKNKIEVMYNSEIELGTIAKLYGLWEGCLEIVVYGDICIEEGNTDELEILLKRDDNVVEQGIIRKTYGEYYIADYGAAMPEVEDDLEINLNEVQAVIQKEFDDTIQLISTYINIFEEE